MSDQVIADGNNNFVLHHQETGETLEISPVFLPGGGAGLPGNADAGGMQIASYVQPRRGRRRKRRQQQRQPESQRQSKGQKSQIPGSKRTASDLDEGLPPEMGSDRTAHAATAPVGVGAPSLPDQEEPSAETTKKLKDLEDIGALGGSRIDAGVTEERIPVAQDEGMNLEENMGLAAKGLTEKEQEMEAEPSSEMTSRTGREVTEGPGQGVANYPGVQGEEVGEEAEGTGKVHGLGEGGREDSDGHDRQRESSGRSDDRARARGSLSRNTVLVTKEVRCVGCMQSNHVPDEDRLEGVALRSPQSGGDRSAHTDSSSDRHRSTHISRRFINSNASFRSFGRCCWVLMFTSEFGGFGFLKEAHRIGLLCAGAASLPRSLF